MRIDLLLVIIYFSGILGSTTEAPGCKSDPPTCKVTQYCIPNNGVALCRNCNPACNGCIGPGSENCIKCKAGYQNIAGDCKGILGSTTEAPGCKSDPPTCKVTQYCIPIAGGALCRNCNPACNGCIGPGSENCIMCKAGYQNITGDCRACPPNTYGENCSGTCRCLLGASDCNNQTGDCKNPFCDLGWTGIGDQCQIPCANKTYGSNCKYQCHCPVLDTCSPINGLCSSGNCAVGWASAGCQTELPQLGDPPTVTNITCGSVMVHWIGWREGIDRGDQQAIIARYEMQSSYYTDIEDNKSLWSDVVNIPHNESLITPAKYSETVTGLLPDAFYSFRINVRQKDGDKIQQYILNGKSSVFVFVQCTVPTTGISTTPQPGTTFRPPGPHLLDESQFQIELINNTLINIQWVLLENVTTFNINMTLKYFIDGVGDCLNLNDPVITEIIVASNGSYNISGLLPWRRYIVNVTAENIDYNITDYIQKNVLTPEEAPTGVVRNIQVESVTKNGGMVKWMIPLCEGRGGLLLNYSVSVFQIPNLTTAVRVQLTNLTSSKLDSLVPFTSYGISVQYVNSMGISDHTTNWTIFDTLEDVPGPPSIVSIQAKKASIDVQLEDPVVKNGILTEYTVMVSEYRNFTNYLTKSQIYTAGRTITMTNLSPSTLYFVRATASTSAGEGPFSLVYNITTAISPPPPPVNISESVAGRNETCASLSWEPPVLSTGTVQGFIVSYHESGVDPKDANKFNTTNSSASVCNLLSGRFYDFYVSVLNDAGIGEPNRIQISTEQADPPIPPEPEVINTTSSTIAVALDPVVVSGKPYGYLVFVEELDQNTVVRRAISSSNTTCPGESEIPGYIARKFSHTEIPSRVQFVIGDGVTYGNYTNKLLTDKMYYNVYYVIISYFEGVCKYSFNKMSKSIQAVNQVPVTPAVQIVEDSSDNTLIIVIIVIIVLLIIIAVIIIFLCLWLRNRRNEQKYEQYINEKEENYKLKVFRVDDYNPHKYWNTVHSMRESRYIIVGRELLPDTNKTFTNGFAGMEKSAQPVFFQDEFAELPHGRQSTCNAATLRENELKNRFSHLLPYDHSRVILDPIIPGQSDYINANFIKGYKHQHAYIASQSPFEKETVLDFWRMIWQYEVRCVVMMSNLVEDHIVKCTQYWPDSGRMLYGNFILELIDTSEFATYIIRSLKIRPKTESEWQVVYIFESSYWPEHGVPDDPIPLLEMRQKVNFFHQGHSTPIVVHCGTGVSRTGVYIAIDSLIDQYEVEGMISVYSFVRKMRKDRPAMVRTVKQYIFIYEAIFDAMVSGNTLFECFDLKDKYHTLTQKNPKTGHSYLHGQFHCLQDYTRKLFPTACSNALLPVNVNKNRFSEIVPPDLYRPILTTPGGVGRTDYINAVLIDSHTQFNHYILTQSPLHTTVIDFWKLVYDQEVNTIIMMEPMMYDDDTCAEYWPQNNMKQYEPFFVETSDEFQQENITIRNLKLVCMQKPGEVRHIRQFQFNSWMDSEFIPKSKSMLLDVIDLVQDWQVFNNNNTHPVLVHCKDGATHSGLFVAVSVLCEQAAHDGNSDVFHTIKHMKRRRTQIVDILDQYRFCYKALWDFINMRLPGGTLTEQMSKTRSDRPYSSLSLKSYGTGHDYMPY